MNTWFTNCHHAIRHANALGMVCVGYMQGHGWTTYAPDAPPAGVEPEFLCISTGHLPVPLSESGLTMLVQLLEGRA